MVKTMTFNRVNEHMVQCIIEVHEIDQMGYVLQEIYTNREIATNFMRRVIEKGEEAGFQLNNEQLDIQAILLPNHKLVLNFTDSNPDNSMNRTIENILGAYEAVKMVGKEKLEEILNMTGKEKAVAFQETMVGFRELMQQANLDVQRREEEANPAKKDKVKKDKYILSFSGLSDMRKFCKNTAVEVPSKVYKDGKNFYLLVDLNELNQNTIDSFVFQAQDFAQEIKNDHLAAAYIEEHGDKMMDKEEPIAFFRNL